MKRIKVIGILIAAVATVAVLAGTYMFFKPHRNVQETSVFAELKVGELIAEFTKDAGQANSKYLSSDGNSRVLIIEGQVTSISSNQDGEKVIVLKDDGAKAGLSATFTAASSPNTESVKIGDKIRIKGAITAGNSYDADLDLYEHAILVQCDIVK
jgi:hypothetical protein